MADLGDGNVTALHHYWLHRAVPVVPAAVPLWAWPCSPTILGTQGLALGAPVVLSDINFFTAHSSSTPGPLGAGTGEPCAHVGINSVELLYALRVQANGFTLPAAWTAELRVGWVASRIPSTMDLFRVMVLSGSVDVRVRYYTASGLLELRIGAGAVTQVALALPPDVFHHVAVTHANGTYAVWINGALRLSYTGTPRTGAANLAVGPVYSSSDSSTRYPMYLAGMRYWDVVAYTAPFTPPTALTL